MTMQAGVVRRWDFYWADLEPARGDEQGGLRPVLVLSNDGFNQRFDLVTVLPVIKQRGKRRSIYPFEVLLPGALIGTGVDSVLMPHQIRTITRERLLRRAGALRDPGKQGEIERRVLEHLDIEFEPEFI